MAILLVVGEAWVRRSGRSPEFWDSCVITVWGVGKQCDQVEYLALC